MDIAEIRRALIEELAKFIAEQTQDTRREENPFAEVQPPTSIIYAAATAAAEVLASFERGYRMGDA